MQGGKEIYDRTKCVIVSIYAKDSYDCFMTVYEKGKVR